jgi:energy-coupling factor transport system substrate-specific component
MNENTLKAKDLITTAIFTVIFLAVFNLTLWLASLPVVTYPFAVPVILVPCGIVWAYMRAKMPKRWLILIQCVLITLLMFFIGSTWFLTIGFAAGAAAAELIAGIGGYKSFKSNIAAFAAWGISINFGAYGIILFNRDYYRDFCIERSMNSEIIDRIIGFMNWQVLALTSVLCIAGAAAGMLLGRVMLKKHFSRAGLV